LDWIGLAHDRNNCRTFVSARVNFLFIQNDEKLWSGYTTEGLSLKKEAECSTEEWYLKNSVFWDVTPCGSY
jgi:hypothetical protein